MSDAKSPICLLYTCWPDTERAEAAARVLLDEKLIACCNILPPGKSIYVWKDAVQCEPEIIAFFKTSQKRSRLVRDRLLALHPYDEPAIIEVSTQTDASAPGFVEWVNATVRDPVE